MPQPNYVGFALNMPVSVTKSLYIYIQTTPNKLVRMPSVYSTLHVCASKRLTADKRYCRYCRYCRQRTNCF